MTDCVIIFGIGQILQDGITYTVTNTLGLYYYYTTKGSRTLMTMLHKEMSKTGAIPDQKWE